MALQLVNMLQLVFTLYPAFSANALTTDSSPSPNALIAYCSRPGHVCTGGKILIYYEVCVCMYESYFVCA